MKFWILLLLFSGGLAWGQVTAQGKLVNGTTGEMDGYADEVRLVKLEQTMQVVATQREVRGDYSVIDPEGEFQQGRYLVQAVVGRAIYSQPLTELGQAVDITVYESSPDVNLRATIGSMAVYAHQQTLDLGLFYNLENLSSPPRTLERDGATFTFPTIEGYSNMEANTRRNNMPLRQALAIEEGKASISYPIKPGQTQLMVRSVHPFQPGDEVRIPLLPAQQFMNLLVLPLTLEIEGEGVAFMGDSENEGVRFYEWTRQDGQNELVLTISGKPDDGSAQASRQQAARQNPHGDSQPRIENTPNTLSVHIWWILGAALAVLAALSVWGARRG